MIPKNEQTKALAQRIFLENLEECLYFPKYFQIETVNACNSRCIFCTINDWNKRKDVIMKLELFQKLVDEVKEYADWIEQICLSLGGEPTLDKQLPLRVKMLKDVSIKRVDISTNAQLLTPKFTEELINAGIDEIWVSINGITKETYEKIHRGLNFDIVLPNILELFRLRNQLNPKMVIRIRTLVLPENQSEMEKWMEFWQSRVSPIDRVYAKPPHSFGNQLWKNSEQSINYFADQACISPFSSLIIQTDGTVGMCVADYNAKQNMGDFTIQTIKEIWTGPKFTELREAHLNKRRNDVSFCQGCDIWERDEIEILKR